MNVTKNFFAQLKIQKIIPIIHSKSVPNDVTKIESIITNTGLILSTCLRIPSNSFSLDKNKLSDFRSSLRALRATCSSLYSAEM